MSEQRKSTEPALLPPPTLPQAMGGVLNLAALAADAVLVNVPPYPECNLGDRITLTWLEDGPGTEIARRYAYLPDSSQGERGAQHEIRVRPLWALPPGDYVVQYAVTSRTGNSSQSDVARVSVVGTPTVPTVVTGGVIQTHFFGVYRPGIVGSWIVPGAYSIASPSDVLSQSMAAYAAEGASAPNVVLSLYKNDDGAPFARITSDGTGKTWTPSVDDKTDFVRGDSISVHLQGAQDSAIFLVLAV